MTPTRDLLVSRKVKPSKRCFSWPQITQITPQNTQPPAGLSHHISCRESLSWMCKSYFHPCVPPLLQQKPWRPQGWGKTEQKGGSAAAEALQQVILWNNKCDSPRHDPCAGQVVLLVCSSPAWVIFGGGSGHCFLFCPCVCSCLLCRNEAWGAHPGSARVPWGWAGGR